MGAQTAAEAAPVPAHVPEGLVWRGSFDRFTAEGDDPFLATARLHDCPPVIWATDASYGRPGWVATRHDVISEVFLNHETFTAERKGMIADLLGVNLRLNPIEIDPPAHHGYRRNLNPLFTPKAINAREQSVRQTCASLIAGFSGRKSCDFVAEFAVPFPTYVFLDLMAMPREMAPDFLRWEDQLMRGASVEERVGAARSIYAYLEAHEASQRNAPGNDLMRGIIGATFEGRPLDHLETMGMFYVLYVGGLDTVYSTLGWAMRHLALNPDLQSQLRDDVSLIPDAVEELARLYSVVITHREVAQDTMFHGAPMMAGEEVHLPLMLADRDPEKFDTPHEFHLERKSRHIAFGTGVHSCLGIHLAKREIRIVIEEFLSRFRRIRIPEGEDYKFHTGRTFGIDYLPLEWD